MARQKAVNAGKHRPRLGQNFLADRRAAERIVDALGDLSQATVLEIGPGKGVLTDLLAARARRLIAVELDRVLSAQLRMRYARRPNVEIVEGDVLTVNLGFLIHRPPGAMSMAAPLMTEKARVVGNIPYSITSDILLRLFEFHTSFETIVLMVQREVAERIAAKPGSRDYGLLSATAQLYTRVEKLFTLPPGAFSPTPKVHSTVLRMTVAPQAQSLGVDPDAFTEFLKLSFAQKRKTLFNNLRERYQQEDVRRALKVAGLRPDVRAEAVPLAKAAATFRELRA